MIATCCGTAVGALGEVDGAHAAFAERLEQPVGALASEAATGADASRCAQGLGRGAEEVAAGRGVEREQRLHLGAQRRVVAAGGEQVALALDAGEAAGRQEKLLARRCRSKSSGETRWGSVIEPLVGDGSGAATVANDAAPLR